jgi:hypothetical protein
MNFAVFAAWLGILWFATDVVEKIICMNGYPRLTNA